MKKKKNVYNELEIISGIDTPPMPHKYFAWDFGGWVKCKCSCGNIIDLPYYGVRNGKIKSCGHLRAERSRETLEKNKQSVNFTERLVMLKFGGKEHNITEWSRITGIPKSTLRYRYKQGYSPKKILKEYWMPKYKEGANSK